MWLAGIDLAGKDANPTYICFYSTEDKCFAMKKCYSDEHILKALDIFKPKIIAVDAPLSLPNKENHAFREAEKELIRMGYRPLPLTLPSMRMLYERAKKLLPFFMRYGEVIEVFATASLSTLRINKEYALRVLGKNVNKDELDALACCISALFYHRAEYREIGNKNEGTIIVPFKDIL